MSQEKSPTTTVLADWAVWFKRATEAAEQCDDIPERGEEFATSVKERLEGIAETIERTRTVTTAQARAIENMEHGIERWIER